MRRLLTGLLLGLLAPVAGAAETPTDFATGMPLSTPGKEAFYRVELPFAVHARARPDLRDVRVFNAAGEALPMALLPARPLPPDTRPEQRQVPFFPLPAHAGTAPDVLDFSIARADGRIISLRSRTPATGDTDVTAVLLDLTAVGEDVQGLNLEWADSNERYSAEARLEASTDLRQWQPLASAALVDIHYGGQRLLQRHFDFTPARYRYLRLSSPSGLPTLARTTVLLRPREAAPVLRRWREVTATPGKSAGEYEFDLGAHLVADALELRLPEPNTVAPVQLRVRSRRDEDWRAVAGTSVYRVTQQGREITSPALEVGLVPGRYWQVVVDPRAGGLGHGLPVLRLGWQPQQAVFVARGQPPFTLAWGRRSAPASQLPLDSLLPGYRAGDENRLLVAAPQAAIALGGQDAPPPGQEDHPPTDWTRWLLWGVLLLGVAVLAFMARSLLRQPPKKD